MKDGFIKVAAGTVDVVVADVQYNTEQILARMREADAAGVNLLTLPELCLTGYTCGDLFFSDCLLGAVEPALAQIVEASKGLYPVTAVGLPLRFGGKLYNCAAVIHAGQLLGVVPKTHLPNYGEFYELRQFSSAKTLEGKAYTIPLCGQNVPFGTALLFCCSGMQDYTFGVELCEDLWVPCPPSTRLCAGGAAIILNLSASDEVIGKADYRRMLVGATSARLACGYIYCSASPTESTQDMVFSRHHLIAENGTVLAENEPFASASLTVSEIDVQRLMHERHRTTSYDSVPGLQVVPFDQPPRETVLTRHIAPNPFVPPYDEQLRAARKRFCASSRRDSKSGWSIRTRKRSCSVFPADWTAHWHCWCAYAHLIWPGAAGKKFCASPCRASARRSGQNPTRSNFAKNSASAYRRSISRPLSGSILRTSATTNPCMMSHTKTARHASARRF